VPTFSNFEVQVVQHNANGYGFNITGPNKSPILATLTFKTQADAEAAREAVQKAAGVGTPGF
jgi:hypothetical protein